MDYLIKPVQRICKYPLLLDQLRPKRRDAHVQAAADEAAGRRTLGFPPAVRLAAVEGDPDAANAFVDEVLAQLAPADHADVLGPVPIDDGTERLLLRVPRASGSALATGVAAVQRVRSTQKNLPVVRVRLDPAEIG